MGKALAVSVVAAIGLFAAYWWGHSSGYGARDAVYAKELAAWNATQKDLNDQIEIAYDKADAERETKVAALRSLSDGQSRASAEIAKALMGITK